MSAKLVFENGIEAHMKEDWYSSNSLLQAYLRAVYPPSSSPSQGRPGREALTQAAEVLDAEIVIDDPPVKGDDGELPIY